MFLGCFVTVLHEDQTVNLTLLCCNYFKIIFVFFKTDSVLVSRLNLNCRVLEGEKNNFSFLIVFVFYNLAIQYIIFLNYRSLCRAFLVFGLEGLGGEGKLPTFVFVKSLLTG